MDKSMPTYNVYVQTDAAEKIIAVNSSIFLPDITNWTQIDEGSGDKYAHAQGNYFDEPLMDENGCCNYKLVDGKPVERTDEEKQAEIATRPTPPLGQTDILGQQLAALTLSGAEKDTLISQLGEQSVQMQLEIASLKGGAAS